MCEIFGWSGNRERELNTDLRAFYAHAPEHPNGWGLALFYDRDTYIKRESVRADKSAYLAKKLAQPIAAKNALAHIRLATIGDVDLLNCHPFTGRDRTGRCWTLVHNGTIFESEALKKYVFREKGETDSERILLYLLDRINEETLRKCRPLTAAERFAVLDEIVRGSSPKNKLNLLIFDGELTYVHTNFKDSLYYRSDPCGVTFSTQPLSDGDWRNVDFTTLLGYQDGKRVFTGTNHGNEYFYDENSYQALYLAYAGL